MQTFLPYPDFAASARALDDQRLGNQRNECYVILDAIIQSEKTVPKQIEKAPSTGISMMFGMPKTNSSKIPWSNHPATRMWRPYRWALLCYSFTIIREYKARGYADNTKEKFLKLGNELWQHELEHKERVQNDRHQFLPNVYDKVELMPWWLGHKLLHASHRSNLMAKDAAHYSQFEWEEGPGIDYYWPM